MRTFVLDTEYKAVTGQQTRFFVMEEAIDAASVWTRQFNRPLKIWEYRNQVRALAGLVQPDGTLVVPKKDVTQVAADLYEKGHKDLADELLES
ncbi:hypothetical protein LCGC14_0407450 [marine sediment metagenome]|uniref:Uncharacterized protein n=1 Tax=marine sediment metagenome TaxID=412755 RepID=A0A0F9W434_9ZZZZ